MIFPDVILEEWMKQYPALEVVSRNCPYCRKPRITNIPFIDKEWVGLCSTDCSCGQGKAISVSMPRIGSEAERVLTSLLDR